MTLSTAFRNFDPSYPLGFALKKGHFPRKMVVLAGFYPNQLGTHLRIAVLSIPRDGCSVNLSGLQRLL